MQRVPLGNKLEEGGGISNSEKMGMDSAKGSALLLVALAMAMSFFFGWKDCMVMAKPRRILLDTDVDTDDFFALLYILKQNRSEFDLKVTIFFFQLDQEALVLD